jgi:hypothetical protein
MELVTKRTYQTAVCYAVLDAEMEIVKNAKYTTYLTFLLPNSMEQSPFEKLIICSVSQNILRLFFGTRRFLTVFPSSRHHSLS